MVVGIVCVAAIALALACLTLIIGRLLRRIKDLDAQLATARNQVGELNEVLAKAPGKAS